MTVEEKTAVLERSDNKQQVRSDQTKEDRDDHKSEPEKIRNVQTRGNKFKAGRQTRKVMTDQSRSDKTEQERFDKQAQVREIRQDSIHETERGSAGEIRQGYVAIEGNSDRSDMSVEERTYGCIEEIRQGE